MSWTFNPPPGWPLPSGDWTSPPDWEPDPEWPPAPPGWEFWVHTGGPASAPPAVDPWPTPPPFELGQDAASPPPEQPGFGHPTSPGPFAKPSPVQPAFGAAPAGQGPFAAPSAGPAYPPPPHPGRRRSGARILVGAAVAAVILLACSGGTVAFTWDRIAPRDDPEAPPVSPGAELPGWDDCDSRPNDCNTGAVAGGTLTWGAPGTVGNWNVYTTIDTAMAQVMSGILPATGGFLPDGTWQWNLDLLAEEPVRVEENPDTYRYRILGTAKWSDGTGISADDFIFAWKHNSRDDDRCDRCPTVLPGYDLIDTVAGADRGQTVEVTFHRGESYPEWFTLFAGLYPAHLAEAAGYDLDTPKGMKQASEWFEATVPDWSGGPWRIASADTEQASLQPNDEWYGPAPANLDEIVVRFFYDPEAMRLALESGDVDGLGPLYDPEPQEVVQQPDLLSQVRSGLVWDHLDVNLEREWTGDAALRRAILTAVDVQEVIDVAYPVTAPDTEPRRNHLFPPGSRYYEDHLAGTGQGSGDIPAALAILEDAGYEVRDGALTRDGEPVGPLVLALFAGNPRREVMAETVANQLAGIGIELDVRPDDITTVLDEQDHDLILFGWSGGPTFSGDGYDFWHSAGGSNYGGYENADVDSLVDQARYVSSQDLAAELLNQAMRYLVDDAYVLPITATPEHIAVRDEFRNVRPNPFHPAGPFYNSHEWGRAAGD